MSHMAISLAPESYQEIIAHLLRADSADEEAAFAFAHCPTGHRESQLIVSEFELVRADDFAVRSPWFLELRDSVRSRVIKRAHDLNASIIEFHSHPGGLAQFSWSDKAGLCEFVPHVRWRLRGRPYAAVVVAPGDCDGLAWIGDSDAPRSIDAVLAGNQTIRPSGWSSHNWNVIGNERKPV